MLHQEFLISLFFLSQNEFVFSWICYCALLDGKTSITVVLGCYVVPKKRSHIVAGNNFLAYKPCQLCPELHCSEVTSAFSYQPIFTLTELYSSLEWGVLGFELIINMCSSSKDHFNEIKADTTFSLWCPFEGKLSWDSTIVWCSSIDSWIPPIYIQALPKRKAALTVSSLPPYFHFHGFLTLYCRRLHNYSDDGM